MKVINHEDSLRKLVDSVNAAQNEQIENKKVDQVSQETKPGASGEKPVYKAPEPIPLYSDMKKQKPG